MTDEVGNLVLEQLRPMRGEFGVLRNEVAGLRTDMLDNFAETRARLGALELAVTNLSMRSDRVETRLDRIERRLDLAEAP